MAETTAWKFKSPHRSERLPTDYPNRSHLLDLMGRVGVSRAKWALYALTGRTVAGRRSRT
jgi:hypothetical protein